MKRIIVERGMRKDGEKGWGGKRGRNGEIGGRK